jgi:hypothetical protein
MSFAATRFALNGYHPTSVQEIVGGLGVGKGVFYWKGPPTGAPMVPLRRSVTYSSSKELADIAQPSSPG